MKKLKMILASGSPRRKELVGWLKIPFRVMASDVEEVTDFTTPEEVVIDLARLKGRDILNKNKLDENLIIASDTIVAIDGKILGKPKNQEDARQMLKTLSGREHEVFTAIYFVNKDKEKYIVKCSKVKFSEITPDLLEHYLAHDEYKDKAGSYGIQGMGLLFVENLNGSYSNVVGFPLSDFFVELKNFISELGYDSSKWNEIFE